jgi:hypothetical protein
MAVVSIIEAELEALFSTTGEELGGVSVLVYQVGGEARGVSTFVIIDGATVPVPIIGCGKKVISGMIDGLKLPIMLWMLTVTVEVTDTVVVFAWEEVVVVDDWPPGWLGFKTAINFPNIKTTQNISLALYAQKVYMYTTSWV